MSSVIATALGSDVVRYSQVWEDWQLADRALGVTPDDHVLCVTSGGDNVLALLLREPRQVTAIDLNFAQSALFELKLAGIRRLSHNEFVSLMGLGGAHDRLVLYESLRDALPPSVRDHWDARTGELNVGLAHMGRLERYIGEFERSHLAALVPPFRVDQFLQLASTREQRDQFDGVLGIPEVETRFCSYFGREMMERHGRHAEQMRYVPEVETGAWFWRRLRDVCTRLPVRGNFYLEFFLRSTYRDLEAGPLYLRRENFERLRHLVDRVDVVTAELGDWLEEERTGSASKCNLSDIFEYLSEDETAVLFEKLIRGTRCGTRICYWNLLVPRSAPASLRRHVRRHEAAASALGSEDRSWFYRAFHIDEVTRP